MSPVLLSLGVMISKTAITACTFYLVRVAMIPLNIVVDNKIKEMESQLNLKEEK